MSNHTTLALTGGTAYLGRDLCPVTDAVVVTHGRRIAAAGPATEVTIPPDARVIDVGNGTLVPGFIDAHVHIALADPGEVLRRGVTTVRDLAWPPEQIFALARRSREPDFDGPLVVAAGPMLTVAGGYPITAAWAPEGTGRAVASEDDASAAVAGLARSGASVIKVALNPPAGNVLDAAVLRTICDSSHEHGLRVTAHIHGLDELHKALDAGVDELAHMLMSPEILPDETIARLVGSDVCIVPTLSIFPPGPTEIATQNLSRFVARGGRVVYGTDLGNEGPGPGIDLLEVTRMEAAGIAVPDIVRAATVDAASWLGLTSKGALAPGMDADIVAIEGAVTQAADLARVAHVVREGRVAS